MQWTRLKHSKGFGKCNFYPGNAPSQHVNEANASTSECVGALMVSQHSVSLSALSSRLLVNPTNAVHPENVPTILWRHWPIPALATCCAQLWKVQLKQWRKVERVRQAFPVVDSTTGMRPAGKIPLALVAAVWDPWMLLQALVLVVATWTAGPL